jgi:hypothetical protein
MAPEISPIIDNKYLTKNNKPVMKNIRFYLNPFLNLLGYRENNLTKKV